jgi:hypothetical protein
MKQHKNSSTYKLIKKIKRIIKWFRLEVYFFIFYLKSIFQKNYLNKLAEIYKSDKWGAHFYTPHYITHFHKFKNNKINLLEIGVGGYDNPHSGGNSLRMWKRYFSKGNIFSIDIYDKTFLEEKRIKIFKGSQIDKLFLSEVVKQISELDIIIDDGSHINNHVIETFNILFPFLKEGGIYVIEDTQTSYWPECGGDSKNLNDANTTMNFFKKLTDGLNYKELLLPGYQPSYLEKNIVSMHFYHNLIFIYKGNNNEESNLLRNNQLI